MEITDCTGQVKLAVEKRERLKCCFNIFTGPQIWYSRGQAKIVVDR